MLGLTLKSKAVRRIVALQDENDRLYAGMTLRLQEIEQLGRQLAHWRSRAEAAESSPEIKADTEAAFGRGKAYKGNQVRSGITISTRPGVNQAINELRAAVNKHLDDLERGCHEESSAGTVVIHGKVPIGENVTRKIADEIERANKTHG